MTGGGDGLEWSVYEFLSLRVFVCLFVFNWGGEGGNRRRTTQNIRRTETNLSSFSFFLSSFPSFFFFFSLVILWLGKCLSGCDVLMN